ncbi:hypothetical protein [Burkholderia sp. Bp8986]|uniref:hypothetical protein n=1 Tax=Burkholderia sp. Bp8986 TaxID=2184550 RepID=UPI000F5A052A|nr:hypothetical protein [Burkholderia sp. Bp8986]RQS50246.1 hypothetical protein DID99_24510 [Burkholderia sp. Bp8986]
MALQWIEYLKQSGWMDLLKVGGVAGTVSSVVTLGWNEFREARASRREARHVALTVALSLESYARDARLMMHRADWARQEAARLQKYDPLRSVALSEFAFPEPIDWKWLKHRVASQLREFPAALHSTRQSLSGEWEYGDPLDWCAEVEFECAKAAMRALGLSHLTRTKHGVAPWKPAALDADLERELTQFIAEQGAKREAFREKQRQAIAHLTVEETVPTSGDGGCRRRKP